MLFTAKFRKKSSGLVKQTFYVKADTYNQAEEIAKENCRDDMKKESLKLTLIGKNVTTNELKNRINSKKGYNTGYTPDNVYNSD